MTDIAFLLPAANGGGAERAMIAVANRFAAGGLAVDMVLVRQGGPFLDEIDASVRVAHLDAGALRKSLWPLHRYMKRARPRLTISALVSTDLAAIVGKALLRWPTHLHISVQNSPSGSAGVAPDPLERNWPIIIRTFYRFADSISAISQGVARDVERMLGRPPGAIPVVNNPVDIDKARRGATQGPPVEWTPEAGRPVIVAVGRLTRQKDIPTLLEAFARLRKTRPARLVILGEGPDRPKLEAEAAAFGIADDLSMPGFSPNPFAAMAAAELFVLSSRWEGFANVVAEALACGAKVVSTDCPSGPAEILEDGRYGTLVPVGDAAALAAGMDAALDAKVDREVQRRRAEAFSLDQVMAGYRALFSRLGLPA